MPPRNRPPFQPARSGNFGKRCLATSLLVTLLMPAHADKGEERVRGYFCNSKKDTSAFLALQAQGENEIMAANAVNKSIGKFSCAPYLPATAVKTGEQTIFEGGLAFRLQGYMFLPEKVERWSGSVLGSLQETAERRDI
jgi:hypothetical protein